MDLAQLSPEYVKELAAHHVGGRLKVAPEHTDPEVLGSDEEAAQRQLRAVSPSNSRRRRSEAGKPKQYLVPYFIASHPGSRPERDDRPGGLPEAQRLSPDQVQDFIPAPFDIATCM